MISNKFVYLPIPLGYLFVGPSNTSNSSFLKLKGSKELLLIYSKEFESSKKIPNHLYYNIAVSYFKLGCYKLALQNSFCINPFDLKNYQLIKIIFLFLSSIILIPFSNKRNIKNLMNFEKWISLNFVIKKGNFKKIFQYPFLKISSFSRILSTRDISSSTSTGCESIFTLAILTL